MCHRDTEKEKRCPKRAPDDNEGQGRKLCLTVGVNSLLSQVSKKDYEVFNGPIDPTYDLTLGMNHGSFDHYR